MEHTLQQHLDCVHGLCRVCGYRTVTQKTLKRKPAQCQNFRPDMILYYRINVDKDIGDKHSSTLCKKCLFRIYALRKRTSDETLQAASKCIEQTVDLWTSFDPSLTSEQCSVCSHFLSTCRGCIKPNQTKPTEDQTLSPHAASAEHADSSIVCQTDSQLLTQNESESSMSCFTSPLMTSTPYTRQVVMKDSTTSPMVKDKADNITVKSLLQKPVSEPLTKMEEKIATSIVRRKLYTSNERNTIKYKTKGQPLTFHRITGRRVVSDIASSPTRKRRSNVLQRVRTHMAGAETKNLERQHLSDLKRIQISTRRNVIRKSGVREKVAVDTKYALAMKEELGLTWRQDRMRRRLWKKLGVYIPSEYHEREICSKITSQDVIVDTVGLQTGLGKTQDVTVVNITDLSSFIEQLLDRYDSEGKLTWHDGGISEDEVWIKVGGDHGRNSMKFCLQIGNVVKPNAKENTHIIGMARVKDSHENIKRIFHHTTEQINRLSQMKWRGKNLIVFLFGDYDFMCKIYGLSGPQGVYPCLWCLQSRTDMQTHGKHTNERTLGSMNNDQRRFIKYGKANLANAKRFHNCIRTPMFDIDIKNISPPYLHILLGVTLKHHKLLESETHALDLKLAQALASQSYDKDETAFEKYVQSLRRKRCLEEQIQFLEGCYVFARNSKDRTEYESELQKCKGELEDMPPHKLTEREGPVTSSLDKILDKFSITPQAYHSRSFVGNHCHRYMTKEVFTALTKHVINETAKFTEDQEVLDMAFSFRAKFDRLNEKFATVHALISHARKIRPEEHSLIDTAVRSYMEVYRKVFPQAVTPKLHILENHCLEFIKRWGFGLGFHGEQGGEYVHSTIGQIERRTMNVKNEAKRLKAVMSAHQLQVAPELKTLIPPSRKHKG